MGKITQIGMRTGATGAIDNLTDIGAEAENVVIRYNKAEKTIKAKDESSGSEEMSLLSYLNRINYIKTVVINPLNQGMENSWVEDGTNGFKAVISASEEWIDQTYNPEAYLSFPDGEASAATAMKMSEIYSYINNMVSDDNHNLTFYIYDNSVGDALSVPVSVALKGF